MRIGRQIAMVFNLDKCLGCNTCTVACKNVWTNREGAEYMWWNNVETKPGVGYPRQWENQDRYRGGWVRTGNERKPVKLRARGKASELLNIFYNPVLPTLEDYAGKGPFTFTYEDLHSSEQQPQQPVGRPKSLITGEEDIPITWGVNWEDNAAGTYVTGKDDVNFRSMSEAERDAYLEYEKVFYFYLPRICNHCMNPGCVAACPSGAGYKREEDGIVLIDQDVCRAWRQCITSCPYKKTYYNWRSGKMEKCVLCYPRVETGQAPACFHSCVGRIRYMGPLLYDMDRVVEAAGRPDDELVEAQREIVLDPDDPEVIAAAREQGVSDAWLEACRRSPVYKMFIDWKIALPLHPEFRTMPSLRRRLAAGDRQLPDPAGLPVLDVLRGEHRGGQAHARAPARPALLPPRPRGRGRGGHGDPGAGRADRGGRDRDAPDALAGVPARALRDPHHAP